MSIILLVDILPLIAPKTRAFGGVATGNIKAFEQVMTADITKYTGLIHRADDISINMGITTLEVAVLLT